MINKEKKKWILLLPALLLLFTVGVAQDKQGIAKVNGLIIVQQELDREMQRNRALIAAMVTKEFDIKDMSGFWTNNYGGQTPLEVLHKKALETMVFFKVQEQLLKERNLWSYNNYVELIED